MDYLLKRDLEWFFDVYQGRVSDNLRSKLSPALARAIEQMLASELDQLKDSILARVEKYIQSGT